MTAWADDAATVRDALEAHVKYADAIDVPETAAEEREALAALARLTALLETQEQREAVLYRIQQAVSIADMSYSDEMGVSAEETLGVIGAALAALRTTHDTERDGFRAWIVEEMDKARAIDANHGQPWAGDSAIAILHWGLGNDYAIGNLAAETTRLREGLRVIAQMEPPDFSPAGPEFVLAHPEAFTGPQVARALLAGEPQTCDGSRDCKAPVHMHGCYSDNGTNCDHPSEHGGEPQTEKQTCRHGKQLGTEHCNECQIAGFCDCPECRDHA